MKLLRSMSRNESGQVLTMALVLLALGGLLVVPVLSLTGTNLNANRQISIENQELYAADAGLENVMWVLMYDTNFKLPTDTTPKTVVSGLQINNKTVNATITKTSTDNVYIVNSTATSPNGHHTVVRCYVNAGSKYSFLFDYAVVSAGSATIKPGATINGDVVYGTTQDVKGIVTGNVVQDTSMSTRWPTEADLNTFYNVSNLPTWGVGSKIDLKNYAAAGIGLVGGCQTGGLIVDNTGPSATIELNGTMYVKGNLTFNEPGASKAYDINLNGHTLYATGNISCASKNIEFSGSGSVIAVGNVELYPGIANSPDDYILILSVKGYSHVWPQGNFYGTIAGYTESFIGSGTRIEGPPPATFQFPGMGGGAGGSLGGKAKLLTYTINPN
jgi:hypothetical protein